MAGYELHVMAVITIIKPDTFKLYFDKINHKDSHIPIKFMDINT